MRVEDGEPLAISEVPLVSLRDQMLIPPQFLWHGTTLGISMTPPRVERTHLPR